MQLSTFTDYSLRVLIFVGLHPNDRASITEVADAYGISRNHVVKVVHRLQSLGYLATFRGRNGGIELGRPKDEVRIGTLVQELENLQLAECFKPDGQCVLTGHCILQKALGEARTAFLATLDIYTLADFTRPAKKLKSLLTPT